MSSLPRIDPRHYGSSSSPHLIPHRHQSPPSTSKYSSFSPFPASSSSPRPRIYRGQDKYQSAAGDGRCSSWCGLAISPSSRATRSPIAQQLLPLPDRIL
jgi:hypothetical protein